jgi:sugar/nucleoside kinase (ribokinase family)
LGECGRVDEVLEEVGMELLRVMLNGESGSSRSREWERGVVIRCGSKGCMVFTASGFAELPAYYTESTEDQGQVVDVTGGGNAFLGGLVAGLASRPGMTLVEGELGA